MIKRILILSIIAIVMFTGTILADSPGVAIGTTYYDEQTNGSTGNRIAQLSNDVIYACWMNSLEYPLPRHIYYNWANPAGGWCYGANGQQINENSGAGYTTLDVLNDNYIVVVYHEGGAIHASINYEDYYYDSEFANDTIPYYWPYVALDNRGYIHIIAADYFYESMTYRLGYIRSQDYGGSWTDFSVIDTVEVAGAVIASSPVSNKVVIAYLLPIDTFYTYKNDIVYIVSENGTYWNWQNKHNITNYANDNDSLWAYTDLDVLIDYNDDINIIWNDCWVSTTGEQYPHTNMKHYSSVTDETSIIQTYPDSDFADIGGRWNLPMCKMSLAADSASNLFAVWTQFDTTDVAANGYGNGELYMTYSIDNGRNWDEPINITNTSTPGCAPGECDSENWSSLDELVDDSLRIIYIADRDAGAIPQTEGSAIEDSVMYLAIAKPEVPVGISDVPENLPAAFILNQNYPNPFNAQTEISFNLKQAGRVSLNIYDITGAKVTTLIDSDIAAGNHSVIWDASEVASGVYFYRLTTDGATQVKQAVLIK